MSNRKKVVVIPGDDAAPEAVYPTIEVLKNLGLEIDFNFPSYGESSKTSHGTLFPEETRRAIDEADATLFGAGSGASTPLFNIYAGAKTHLPTFVRLGGFQVVRAL